MYIPYNTIKMYSLKSSRALTLIDGFDTNVNEVFFETSVCFPGCVCFSVWTADGSWHLSGDI